MRWLLLAALSLSASSAWATPLDLTSDPVARQGWIARQSVYRVGATFRVTGFVKDGKVTSLGAGHSVTITGTAFGVVEGGVLATAAHVVAPSGRAIATLLERQRREGAGERFTQTELQTWADEHRIDVRGLAVVKRVARRIHEPGVDRPPPRLATLLKMKNGNDAIDDENDLALLRIQAPAAQALALGSIPAGGSRVALVGFGAPSDGETPATKVGEIGSEERGQDERRLIPVAVAVRQGDSGGPAVDEQGKVLGLASLAARDGRDVGALTPVQKIRDLMESANLANVSGTPSADLGAAMQRLWAFDLEGARKLLDRALTVDPSNTTAAFERNRLTQLVNAGFSAKSSGRFEGALAALAIAAAAASLAFAAAASRRLV